MGLSSGSEVVGVIKREQRARLVYEVARRHRRGDSIRSIAKGLNIARKTVRRMLNELQQRRVQGDDVLARETPSTRAPRASKLDPFTDQMVRLLNEYPDIRATRMHEELAAEGFAGSYTIVRERLKTLRPKPALKPRQLVMTPPGKQGQFDWTPFWLADGTPIYMFTCVLSYSRKRYSHFCGDMRQSTIFRELRRSFEFHGGVAHEYVTDTMAGVVDRWELGEPILNLRAVDFAAFYNFALHIAPRGDGAYKGKVERTNRHANESLMNARTFHSLEEANAALQSWLSTHCNGVKHKTTGRTPDEAFRDELPHLLPLPAHPYDDRELAHRIVDAYSYVRFDGNRYRAPKYLVGRWVYVRASDELVEIVSGAATVVVRHGRAPRNAGQLIPPPEQDHSSPRRLPIAKLMSAMGRWGPTAEQFAVRVRERKRYPGVELGRIFDLRSEWAMTDILAAIEHAAAYQAWDAESVQRILMARFRPRTLEDHIAAASREHIRQTMAEAPVKQRPLERYGRLLGGRVDKPGAPEETDDEHNETT